jgi:fatty acid amide hydrolase 2
MSAGERPPTQRSALELAAAIRGGELSSREVVDEHIALLERVNPRLNAVIFERLDDARAEADAADVRIAAAGPDEQLPPLLGVPFTIKESICVEGMPNSTGCVARRDFRSAKTAPTAQRLLDTGAILLGLTNTSELTLWIESENRLYGRTRNAYDPTRIAGGSSGGEGAIVASGASPFGLGSDIGGSIRIPAFCGGVFGHKSSPGLVPLSSMFPEAGGESARLLGVGPLARRAEDLMPLLRTLAGPDGVDPLAREMELGDPANVELEGLRVILSEGASFRPISRELLAARERAADALAAAGARVERVSMKSTSVRRGVEPYLATLADGGSITEILAAEGAAPLTFRSSLRRGGDHTVALRLMLNAQRLSERLPERRNQRLIEKGRRIAEQMRETIGDGVVLHPPMPGVAPRHGRTIGRLWWAAEMAWFNLAGVPVTQVPLGLNQRGLPLGVQVAAGPGRDHVTIAVAQALERAFGGWVPPSPTASRARPAGAAAPPAAASSASRR